MNNYRVIIICCCAVFAFSSCKKDNVDYRYPDPFDGQTIQLPGIAGNEEGYYAANSVFVDFSIGTVSAARRDSWNLGFYPGPEFKVIINHSMGAMVVDTKKTDLTAVGSADSIAIAADKVNGTLNFSSPVSSERINPVIGNATDYLSKLTLIKVGKTEGESTVYIVSSGMAGTTRNRIPPATSTPGVPPNTSLLEFPWYKFKVYEGINRYLIKYGPLNGQAFNESFVNKNASYNFNYLSFNSRSVNVEPAKSLWDIEWTWSTYQDANGRPDSTSNFVLINFLGGVKAAQLTVSTARTYESFSNANLGELKETDYLDTRDAIGTKWRTISETLDKDKNKVQVASVNGNLFYVIKDGEGNYYKLRFKSAGSGIDGGANGRPVIEYKLVRAVANPSL
jgi:hypothetical protein